MASLGPVWSLIDEAPRNPAVKQVRLGRDGCSQCASSIVSRVELKYVCCLLVAGRHEAIHCCQGSSCVAQARVRARRLACVSSFGNSNDETDPSTRSSSVATTPPIPRTIARPCPGPPVPIRLSRQATPRLSHHPPTCWSSSPC
jgi:hypothetical protein